MPNRISAGRVTEGTLPDPTDVKVDLAALRNYRYARVQQLLRENGCAAALLINPINIRYATDTRNMTVWLLHNMGRYCIVPAEGPAVLFEYANKNAILGIPRSPLVADVRLGSIHSFFDSAEHAATVSRRWAAEIFDVVTQRMGRDNLKLAIDRADLVGTEALRGAGFTLVEGQRVMELARSIKNSEEIACMRASLAVADIGMERMRLALRPGISEQELWAKLHSANIEHGGEWIETRLLSSGPRTNPWLQEASARLIEAGDLVSFDTDMVGPYGYCSDVSRTFHCGPGRPSDAQRSLHALAEEQIRYNCELLAPGLTFRQFTERAWKIPARYWEQNYGCVAHGVGMVDEWPAIGVDPRDPCLQDGVMAPGMVICVESYLGEVGGTEGVKLEEQVLITTGGHEILSRYPIALATTA